jgi:hypothetical protein
LYECAQENGKGFTASGGGIYNAALAKDDVVPCLFLEGKWGKSFFLKPCFNYLIAGNSLMSLSFLHYMLLVINYLSIYIYVFLM